MKRSILFEKKKKFQTKINLEPFESFANRSDPQAGEGFLIQDLILITNGLAGRANGFAYLKYRKGNGLKVMKEFAKDCSEALLRFFFWEKAWQKDHSPSGSAGFFFL